MTNYLYEQMERTEEPIGLDSLSKEEIIFSFFIWHSGTANPGQDISEKTIADAWEAAHEIQPQFLKRGYNKKETIQHFIEGICEDTAPRKIERQIVDAILKQVGIT